MGKITTAAIFISTLFLFQVQAQNHPQQVLKIKGTRLVYPLMRKWISEYKKVHPETTVLISPSSPSDSIDFSIASYELTPGDLKDDLQGVVVAKYVQLPIVNINRKDLGELQTRGITEEQLKNIFFGQQPVALSASNAPSPLELYVRDRPVCAVKAFAGHFGEDPSQINGHGIKGDDEELATAVRNDVNGLSFNNLGFIYDVKTRKISKDLAIIPMDLNKNGKVEPDEQIYATLDNVIEFVERTHHEAFINENVNLTYHKDSQTVAGKEFLKWILTNGQNYNHEFGFLLMDKSVLSAQQAIVAHN